MISIKNLTCKYNDKEVFSNLNLEINNQDFVVITGQNGTGKTTLLKALLGLIKYEGNIIIDNLDAKQALKKHIVGYVPQIYHNKLNVAISVAEFLNIYLDKANTKQVVSLLQIDNILKRNINDLSGGQQQLVFIAKTLHPNLQYLILDEPNNGLDYHVRKRFFNLLSELNKQGITIILITHYLDEISCQVNKIFNIETKQMKVVNNHECQYC